MTTSIVQLEAEVLGLGPAKRARLLERLIDSFEPESKLQESWIAEASRRHNEIKEGEVAAVPGKEAVARIRARIS